MFRSGHGSVDAAAITIMIIRIIMMIRISEEFAQAVILVQIMIIY